MFPESVDRDGKLKDKVFVPMSDHPSLNFQIFIKPKHPKLASEPVLARPGQGQAGVRAAEDENCGLMDNVSTAARSEAVQGNYYTILLRLNPNPGPGASDACEMVN